MMGFTFRKIKSLNHEQQKKLTLFKAVSSPAPCGNSTLTFRPQMNA